MDRMDYLALDTLCRLRKLKNIEIFVEFGSTWIYANDQFDTTQNLEKISK